MSNRPIQPAKTRPVEGQRPDEAVDLLLDRQLDPDRRRALLQDLSGNAAASQELASLRATVALFDDPIDTPDMSADILAELERRRAFRPARRRLLIRVGRVAVAACLVLTVGAVALVRQHAPALDPTPAPAPISAVVESSHSELAGLIGSTVEIAGRLASGIQPMVASASSRESYVAAADVRDRGQRTGLSTGPSTGSNTGHGASPEVIARAIPLRFFMDASAPAAATSFDDDRVFIYTPAPNPQRPGLLIDADGRVVTLGDPSGLGIPSRAGHYGVDINGVWNRPNTPPSSAGSDFADGFPIPGREH